MVFNSIDFLLFFPIAVIVFFIVPVKVRYIWLLLTSYYFYMFWNAKYALLITVSIVITYCCGLLVERFNDESRVTLKRVSLVGSLVLNLGILMVFKYGNFLLENIDFICNRLGIGNVDRRLDLLLPVGISFYTFQALSYTMDVYNGKIKAEKNILRYALFVSFFPQLVAGPIERSERLLPQIQGIEKIKAFDYKRIREGLLIMMFGYFQKLVIADRASIVVNSVLNDYSKYGLLEICLAVFLFGFQIYCDFGGYTCIAIGAAKVMGFDLMQNFRQPYLAQSIKDFWRRWHISLTSWFTDYLYIPLGGNRKGNLRKYINILIVFGISGLWHGASWHFVIWGLIHALYQIVEGIISGNKEKNSEDRKDNIIVKAIKIIWIYCLVDFAWLFFAVDKLGDIAGIFRSAMSGLHKVGFTELGLQKGNLVFLMAAIAVLLIADILKEAGISVLDFIYRQNIVIRWTFYMVALWLIIMFGIYGLAYDTSTFIYFQF